MAAFMVIALGGTVWAATTAEATVTYEVTAINEISVSGSPAKLTISTAIAGSEPTAATNSLTTYSITTNGTTMKITGQLNAEMDPGLTLKVNLADPDDAGTAISKGDVELSDTTAADLVTGINQLVASGKTITYTLSATVAAGKITSGTKTVTFTITSEP